MNPISICRFNGLTGVKPFVYTLNDLKQFVGFFTLKEPPTVKKEERREFFSMAIFNPGTTRCKQNVKALSGMVLDFDNTEDGRVRLPEFIAVLKALDIISLYYTTWSHTDVRHRWRLILPFAKAVEVNFWPEAHSRVLKLLGNSVGIDEAASRDVARMWIMPCKAVGQPYEIGYQITGKFLNPHTLPLLSLSASPSPVSSSSVTKCLTPTNPTSPASEFATMTPRDIREALAYIDPNIDYDIWLKIGMALQDQFGESGIYIWDAWSAKGSKYKNLKDLQNHWHSFRKDSGITIATLLHYAKERGWSYCRHDPAYIGDNHKAEVIVKEALPEAVLELAEEVQEYADPIAQCVYALKPFAVRDIFDFPCAIIKRIYEWIQGVAPLPQPIFSFSATLSVMAFLKRNAVVSPTNLKTNLYVMVIGPSRSGKNNTLDSINDILRILELQDFATSGFGSAQGLMKLLSEKNGQAYWVQDEIAHLFKNFHNKNAGTYETRLEQKILTLYNCAYQTSDKIKNDKMFVVQNPYLNIFGTTTENIIEVLAPESVVSGLLARFLVFWLKPDGETADYKIKDIDRTLPDDLVSALRTIAAQQESKKVSLSFEAETWLQTFSKTLQKSQQELCKSRSKVDSLVGNLREQTIKIALLVARNNAINSSIESKAIDQNQNQNQSQNRLLIDLADIQWAASVALHCFFNNIELACSLTENKNEQYVNKILKYLKEHQAKWIRRSSLCQLLRYAINTRQLEDLLAPLLESSEIIKTTGHGGALYRLNQPHNIRKGGN